MNNMKYKIIKFTFESYNDGQYYRYMITKESVTLLEIYVHLTGVSDFCGCPPVAKLRDQKQTGNKD